MKIKEVATQFEVTAHTLRYYEKLGILDPVEKDSSGIRDYSEQDLERIHFIKCMKATGMSMEHIKNYIELFNAGDKTKKVRHKILLDQRIELLQKRSELEESLAFLEKKIQFYEQN
ncbi:MAG: MerR family transcriptional regulator [Anaerorhabdus sp.]